MGSIWCSLRPRTLWLCEIWAGFSLQRGFIFNSAFIMIVERLPWRSEALSGGGWIHFPPLPEIRLCALLQDHGQRLCRHEEKKHGHRKFHLVMSWAALSTWHFMFRPIGFRAWGPMDQWRVHGTNPNPLFVSRWKNESSSVVPFTEEKKNILKMFVETMTNLQALSVARRRSLILQSVFRAEWRSAAHSHQHTHKCVKPLGFSFHLHPSENWRAAYFTGV